jgi:lysyl-tRNA synthetase class I
MRAWIDGRHFPEESRIEISKIADRNILNSLDSNQIAFIRHLGAKFKECEWSDSGIGSLIVDSIDVCGIGAKKGYSAIYSVLIGKSNGPKASTLMVECDRDELSELFSLT